MSNNLKLLYYHSKFLYRSFQFMVVISTAFVRWIISFFVKENQEVSG